MKIKVIPISLCRSNVDFQAVFTIIKGSFRSLQPYLSDLHPEEYSTYTNYQHERRKYSYLLGRYAAKHAVAALTAKHQLETICIDRGVFNFPVVSGPGLRNIQVSLSHCLDTGLSVAFPEAHPLGIDVELVDQQRAAVAKSQLTPSEIDLVQHFYLGTEVGSFLLFSAKESLSKVLRTGMMLDFQLIRIATLERVSSWFRITFASFPQYQAYAFFVKDLVYTIVLPAKTSISEVDLGHILAALK